MANIISLHVNGSEHRIDADGQRSLLSVLRDDLDLTGSKYGCGEGQCGACTVLIDGHPRRSCTMQVDRAAGRKILTIEGLEQNGRLHPLQDAFLEVGVSQCGYCASGMIMSGVALLNENAAPSRQDIIGFMKGNICRCGTYTRVITAITRAARTMREDKR